MNKTVHRNQAKSFSGINIGDKTQFDITIDEKLHNSFSVLFGDFSPVHCDDEFCAKTKFKKKIGYAFMLTGFLSKLYGEYLPGGSSICIKQDTKFIKPFFLGDKIRIVGEVVNKVESTQFVEIKSEMYRNEKERIFQGNGIVQIVFEGKLTQPLYEVDNKKIYYSDFIDAFRNIGIKNGDVIFVHSDISVFGKLCTFNRNLLLKTLIDTIKESVGEEGTVIMPTFTYSFCNDEPYDITNSKSTVGVLTEYFRKQPDVSRTIHPIFSVAIWGKHKSGLLDISKNSFGRGSIFEKLHKMKGKIVFLGAEFQTCTFVHYIEKIHGIPHRYVKKFKGKIRNGKIEYEGEYDYFVRYLDRNINTHLLRFEKYLLDKGLIKKVKLGNGTILMVESGVLFKEGYNLLDQDIYFFLKDKPK